MKHPMYRGSTLTPNSKAFELWCAWQKTKDNKDRNALDAHMKALEQDAKSLMDRYKSV